MKGNLTPINPQVWTVSLTATLARLHLQSPMHTTSRQFIQASDSINFKSRMRHIIMLSIQAYETASYACEPFKADTSMHGMLQVSHAKLECLFRLLIHSLNW
ncbi:uncharacterized protein LOC124701941 [Lolium rigidum]|uniref:uncharacterized protein LOC124701941 n=1 Tax=Lolium rigidum TaxID=89674 RepID=UPI001F5DAAA3|nr:uncharacterized protein LOC124701941 [Lolium rigidum]XP_047090002.1 uncharacterized protein LOC124701941 [Lolium rigidum]